MHVVMTMGVPAMAVVMVAVTMVVIMVVIMVMMTAMVVAMVSAVMVVLRLAFIQLKRLAHPYVVFAHI